VKDRGILHPRLARVVALMGHGDALCIADAGLPIPNGVPRIDLAFAPGRPPFLEVLDAVCSELRIERYTLAKESLTSCPGIVDAVRAHLAGADETSVTHEELKQLTVGARAVVRTGEFTPYANVILYSGVDFGGR
jgi:D-ribose pyranase